MQIVYALEDMPYKFSKSLFLAGPTPRSPEVPSWRKDALDILRDIGFDNGIVIVPEPRDQHWHKDHDKQVEWEQKHLAICDCILFWIPRDLETLPGYSTNLEWGHHHNSGRVVLGYPSEDTPKMDYIKYDAEKYHIPISHTLTETIHSALELIGEGAERCLGERYVPIQLWRTSLFQNWYRSQLAAGHRLEKLKVEYNVLVDGKPVISMFRPTVYLPKEDKFKDDEVVVSRFDITSLCLWKEIENDPNNDVEVVLVKEFRSPVKNTSGLVHELPGGAVDHGEVPRDAIVRETLEEIGLDLDEDRLRYIGQRQMSATLLSHSSYLYSYHLNNEELQWLKVHQDVAFGKKNEGEQTFIEVVKLSQLNNNDWIDFTTLGMIMSAISKV